MKPGHKVLNLALLLAAGCASFAGASDALGRGDEAYARRAEGNDGHLARPGPISQAIAAYEELLVIEPENQLARARLLKALFYFGDYVIADKDAKLAVFARGQILGEEGLTLLLAGTGLDRRGGKRTDELIAHLEAEPHAAAIYYWAAVHWGLWGRHKGKIAAAKQGVAGKIRDYASISIALDPEYEDGGGHRMLGRLHAEAPKIPFVTGWIDRETAISELQKARQQSGDCLTALYYAEALLDYDPLRRNYAVTVLKSIVDREPSPANFLEELRAIREARALLDKLDS